MQNCKKNVLIVLTILKGQILLKFTIFLFHISFILTICSCIRSAISFSYPFKINESAMDN